LSSVLLVIQPTAMAGKPMEIGVVDPEGCVLSAETVCAESGTDAFQSALSEAIGAANVYRKTCPGARVSITPTETCCAVPPCDGGGGGGEI
jgi:hypothetical protein